MSTPNHAKRIPRDLTIAIALIYRELRRWWLKRRG